MDFSCNALPPSAPPSSPRPSSQPISGFTVGGWTLTSPSSPGKRYTRDFTQTENLHHPRDPEPLLFPIVAKRGRDQNLHRRILLHTFISLFPFLFSTTRWIILFPLVSSNCYFIFVIPAIPLPSPSFIINGLSSPPLPPSSATSYSSALPVSLRLHAPLQHHVSHKLSVSQSTSTQRCFPT
ncbi:hypothetical protein E2C01_052435 [Portunus trituberculatus]|uniref:Uncharacterized protein n=1 Tax=Portunus trituberculatus TaxID=210409 RepID=A0A5B7GDP2_PORTR|nr:hypothetical protein [Portunus trituberculatus]